MTSSKPYFAVNIQGTVELSTLHQTQFYKHCKAYVKNSFPM